MKTALSPPRASAGHLPLGFRTVRRPLRLLLFARLSVLLPAIFSLVVATGWAEEGDDAQSVAGRAGAEDRFAETFPEGKLSDGWRWLREHPDGHRVRDAALEVRIEPGNMWGAGNDARNVLVRPLPGVGSPSSIALECTVHNRPTHQYEQVDLVLYRDDSNMVKIGLELVDGQVSIVMGREEGDRTRTIAIIPFEGDTACLRLIATGDSVEGAFRKPDEEEWRTAGRCAIPASVGEVPLHLSIQAYQGPPDTEHWGRISDIRITPLP